MSTVISSPKNTNNFQQQDLLQSSLLDNIDGPQAIKSLSADQLKQLSAEVRQEIIHAVSKTGGHLASNLGIVEITVALHHVFNSPEDKIIWDVGHQAYVHKMLTGRRKDFDTLRQYKGLSGFINPLESDHDSFIAGHSSTSISLAVGMALARDHHNKDNKVIAVIGDGGLTGGMALEAINHLGHVQRNVVIILNDNEMSISENVGGFSQYMKRIKESFFYRDIKQKIDEIEIKLDENHLSPALWQLISAVKKQAKDRFDTPGIVFDKLGINYSGPIDGHDVNALVKAMQDIKDSSKPQLLHVITQKGKGYAPAEADSIKWHGVSAFTVEKIEPAQPQKSKSQSYSDVFTQALIDIASLEPNVVAITPATAEGSGLVKFGKIYPERFYDVAICEQHAITMAAGMAKEGLKPVVSIYSTFLQRGLDQVIHDVAILNLPVIFGIDRGGLVEDGETHQGVFDLSFLRTIPNMTVLAPQDTQELRDMLYTAIKRSQGPVAIRFPRDKAIDPNTNSFHEIDFEKWTVLANPYKDFAKAPSKSIVLMAVGSMVEKAAEAQKRLEAEGLSIGLINARSIKPLDKVLLKSLLSNSNLTLVTLEEGCLSGGFGSGVQEYRAAMQCADITKDLAKVLNLGISDHFVEHGGRQILLDLNNLSTDKIISFVKQLASRLK